MTIRRVLGSIAAGLLVPSLALVAPGVAHADGATAKKPAKVSSSVTYNGGQNIRGKLSSKRKSCVRNKDVQILILPDGSDYYIPVAIAETNRRGRWDEESIVASRVGGNGGRLYTYTRSSSKCAATESNIERFSGGVASDGAAASKAPAAVKATLRFSNSGDSARGKLSSKRKSCIKRRPVYIFGRESGDTRWQVIQLFETNGQGRWNSNASPAERLGGGGSVEYYTYTPAVRGRSGCGIAESKTVRVSPL